MSLVPPHLIFSCSTSFQPLLPPVPQGKAVPEAEVDVGLSRAPCEGSSGSNRRSREGNSQYWDRIHKSPIFPSTLHFLSINKGKVAAASTQFLGSSIGCQLLSPNVAKMCISSVFICSEWVLYLGGV